MYQPRPSDIALPPTLAIDLSRLVRVAVAAAPAATQPAWSGTRASRVRGGDQQAVDEQVRELGGLIAGGFAADAEIADAAEERVSRQCGSPRSGGREKVRTDGDEAIDEVSVENGEPL